MENFPETVKRYARPAAVAGMTILAVFTARGDSPPTATETCIETIGHVGARDRWDDIAEKLCLNYESIAERGIDESGLSPLVSLRKSGFDASERKSLHNLIAPIRPFSVEPEADLLVGADNWDVGVISGSTEGAHPFITIDAESHTLSPDTGDVLRWVAFHETAHTIQGDEQFYKELDIFTNGADREIEKYKAGSSSDYPELDGVGQCPDGYANTLFGLFDESSYIDGIACMEGHPYNGSSELLASTISTLHLFPHKFIERFHNLNSGQQKKAAQAIGSIVGLLQRINPNQNLIDKLVAPEIQKLASIPAPGSS